MRSRPPDPRHRRVRRWFDWRAETDCLRSAASAGVGAVPHESARDQHRFAHGANVPVRCNERPEQSAMAVTATIQRQTLKVAGRNIAPGVQFSLLATSASRQARYGSQSQTWLDGADMAALRTRSVVKLHHLGGCSYRVGIARCEIASLVRRTAKYGTRRSGMRRSQMLYSDRLSRQSTRLGGRHSPNR